MKIFEFFICNENNVDQNSVRSKIKKYRDHQMSLITIESNCHSGLSRHLLVPTTCLDYFVFPYLQNNVFKNRPGTIPELMQVITDNCNLIDVPTLRRSFENMKRRQ
jgi:hypothetical protein